MKNFSIKSFLGMELPLLSSGHCLHCPFRMYCPKNETRFLGGISPTQQWSGHQGQGLRSTQSSVRTEWIQHQNFSQQGGAGSDGAGCTHTSWEHVSLSPQLSWKSRSSWILRFTSFTKKIVKIFQHCVPL